MAQLTFSGSLDFRVATRLGSLSSVSEGMSWRALGLPNHTRLWLRFHGVRGASAFIPLQGGRSQMSFRTRERGALPLIIGVAMLVGMLVAAQVASAAFVRPKAATPFTTSLVV